ncbi:XdhC family protein [Sporichthya polymorpha]|uniref:XdhC family protein n=1 Tax=Sporichthya polymorpha TaxID=35751 RepID=UPI00035E73C9|nr:XdhC family protein [Sporichthya polymorpha]
MADQEDPKPLKYRRIADDLRSGIARGEYAPGRALPGENDLMARYRVARMTVRQALAELQREGLAVARRGSGVYVSASAGTAAGPAADTLAETATPETAAVDPSCAVAHGSPAEAPTRGLVVVFAGETARHLLSFGAACGFRGVLVEPDPEHAERARTWAPAVVSAVADAGLDADCDVVVSDHHRDGLGLVLRDALAGSSRWIGVLGNPRHPGPHREQLRALGVPPAEIDRVHRPIGLNIGSRTPAEIAISTLAGLIADRNGRPGGFAF